MAGLVQVIHKHTGYNDHIATDSNLYWLCRVSGKTCSGALLRNVPALALLQEIHTWHAHITMTSYPQTINALRLTEWVRILDESHNSSW